jgi:hypothetical protein
MSFHDTSLGDQPPISYRKNEKPNAGHNDGS